MNRAIVNFNDDSILFSTGKKLYANKGIVGISEYKEDFDGGKIRICITEGYDGGFGEKEDGLTRKERKELANWAISLWRSWAKECGIRSKKQIE